MKTTSEKSHNTFQLCWKGLKNTKVGSVYYFNKYKYIQKLLDFHEEMQSMSEIDYLNFFQLTIKSFSI